jgi:Integrase repeat unit
LNNLLKYRSFIEARDFVHKLGLKSYSEWTNYCKSGEKPSDIPRNVYRTYQKEWKGSRDWLGTETIANQKRQYLSFEEAKKFVQVLAIKNQTEWRNYLKSGNLPNDIPSHPDRVYKKEWKGFGDWLGTGRIANQELRYRTFEESRTFVHNLGLNSRNEWGKYCKSGQKPNDIPYQARQTYKKDWKGWGDWLGTGRIAYQDRKYKKFQEAKNFVQILNINSISEWKEYCKSGRKPEDIPSLPNRTYEGEWKGWGDWLGTGRIAYQDRKYRTFEESRTFVHNLGLNSRNEWGKYCKSGKKPEDVPYVPENIYKGEWKGVGDWLGTGTIANQNKEFLPFDEAREFVHSLLLKSRIEWNQYYKSGKKPQEIPSNPLKTYTENWKGWGDWLGTGRIASFNKKFKTFEEAREFARNLGLKNTDDWLLYCKSGKKPFDIPAHPRGTYKRYWNGWSDWLATENTWSVRRVKELLRALIESKSIFKWDEAVLYSFLLRKGLLNIYGNRHEQFFKNLIQASRTEEGQKIIANYAKSDSDSPPNLSKFSNERIDNLEEIQTASSSELLNLAEDKYPLNYDEVESIDQILEHTNILESINVDEEAMEFYLNYSV